MTLKQWRKQKKKNRSIGIGRGPTTSLLLSIVHSIGDQVNDGGMKFVSLIESLPSKDVRYIKKFMQTQSQTLILALK